MDNLMGLTLIISLATWRLASLLTSERGPLDIFERLRERVGIGHHEHAPMLYPDTHVGNFLGCFWCVSIWCSALVTALSLTIGLAWWIYPLLWLAGSTGSIIVEEVIHWQEQ